MAFPQAGAYGNDNFVDPSGVLYPAGTAVSVHLPGTTTLTTLYTNRGRTGVVSNPTILASLGNLRFYAEPGDYDLLINGIVLRVTATPNPADIDPSIMVLKTSYLAKGAILIATGTGLPVSVAMGAPGEVITADPAAASGVSWQPLQAGSGAPSGPAGGVLGGVYPNPGFAAPPIMQSLLIAKGDLIGTNALLAPVRLPVGTVGQVLSADPVNSAAGVKWITLGATTTATPIGPAGGALTGSYPNPGIAVPPVPLSLFTNKGDLVVGSTLAGTVVRFPIGTLNQVLASDPGQPLGLKWISGGGVATQAVDVAYDPIPGSTVNVPNVQGALMQLDARTSNLKEIVGTGGITVTSTSTQIIIGHA